MINGRPGFVTCSEGKVKGKDPDAQWDEKRISYGMSGIVVKQTEVRIQVIRYSEVQ